MNVEENAYGDMVKKFRECVTQFYLYFAFFLQVLYVGLFVCHAFVIYSILLQAIFFAKRGFYQLPQTGEAAVLDTLTSGLTTQDN